MHNLLWILLLLSIPVLLGDGWSLVLLLVNGSSAVLYPLWLVSVLIVVLIFGIILVITSTLLRIILISLSLAYLIALLIARLSRLLIVTILTLLLPLLLAASDTAEFLVTLDQLV